MRACDRAEGFWFCHLRRPAVAKIRVRVQAATGIVWVCIMQLARQLASLCRNLSVVYVYYISHTRIAKTQTRTDKIAKAPQIHTLCSGPSSQPAGDSVSQALRSSPSPAPAPLRGVRAADGSAASVHPSRLRLRRPRPACREWDQALHCTLCRHCAAAISRPLGSRGSNSYTSRTTGN